MLSFNNSSSLDDGKDGGGGGAKATSKSRALSKELAAQAAEINKDLRIYISQEDKEPKEGLCEASYFNKDVFFVHTKNKTVKQFENSNIYISFLSVKGCSINIRVKFIDPNGHRRVREKKVYRDDPDYENNPESDPFKKLRSMMKLEQEKNRKFKVRMV